MTSTNDTKPHGTSRPPWPGAKRAAISITMDNMAEAADLHRGIHDPSIPLGQHHSITTQLPRMLDLLKSRNITATYFIEGWNNSRYSDTIKTVLANGHEVGFHAWQHEVWKQLDHDTEIQNLDRSIDDAKKHLNVTYKGFRPPGGLVTPHTLSLMKERGFTYLSPAAEKCAVVEGVAMVPFSWPDIDAYFYLESTGVLRKARGDQEAVMSPTQLKDRLVARIDRLVEEGGYTALLFHPFLTKDDERHDVMKAVVDYVKSKEDKLWIAPCKQVAEWVLEHKDEFGDDPIWDTAEWKKK